MGTRQYALLGKLKQPPRTRHSVGLPPELTAGIEERALLPWASVLLIEPSDHGSFLMYRYSRNGEFGGDTWHETVADARDQAAFEFGDAVGPWREVPSDVMIPWRTSSR